MPESSVASQPEPEFAAFVAIDWADKRHVWVLQTAAGHQRESGELEQTPEAIEVWASGLAARFGGQPIAAGLEQSPLLPSRAPGPMRSYAGGVSFPDLLSLADQGDARAARALETMAHYLGRGMRMIVAGLAPERIMIIGDLTRSWQRFGPVIEAEVQAQVLPGGTAPMVIPVHEDGMARLRGTVALILQKHFGTGVEVPS